MESDRWKHLIVGILIALVFNFETSVAATFAADYKDHLWGGKFDWLDVSAGVIGALIGAVTRWIITGRFELIYNLL